MVYQQEITLELNSNTAYTTVGAKQGDTYTREILVHITSDGEDWTIPSNATAQYRVRKPDGKAVWNPAQIDFDSNIVVISLTSQTLASAGRAYADIVLYNGEGENAEILSTVSFIIIIMASPDISGEVVSSNEFGYLQDVVNDASTVISESEAWAVGTRSGVPVLGNSFIPRITSGGGFTFTLDQSTFKAYIGTYPGETLDWILTYTGSENGWQLTYPEGTSEYIDTEEIGLTITSGTVYSGNIITVTISDADYQFQNNSKYWSDSVNTAKESVENLEIETEILPEDDPPSVDKDPVNDITLVTSSSELGTVTIDEDTFVTTIGKIAGDYDFIYSTSNGWQLESIDVNLIDYGISYTGTPIAESEINIHYNQHIKFTLNIPRGYTGNT